MGGWGGGGGGGGEGRGGGGGEEDGEEWGKRMEGVGKKEGKFGTMQAQS